MTVKELIKLLELQPQDAEVVVSVRDGETVRQVRFVNMSDMSPWVLIS